MSWRRDDDYFLGFLRSGDLVPALHLPVPDPIIDLDRPVALCQHGRILVAAWTAQHHGIYVARLHRR